MLTNSTNLLLRPWLRKLPNVVWDDAGSDGVFIEVLLILEFNEEECVPILEGESLVSPSTLYVVPVIAFSRRSNRPFDDANSEDSKSSVKKIDDGIS